MDAVDGTWYIVRTSLPFWKPRQNPTVTYAPLPDGRVVDTVSYTRRGRERLVVGVDEPDPDGSWVWRGITPLTRLVSSRWRVLASADDWAVTHFEKTLFTPAGWDVYCRSPRASPVIQRGFDVSCVELGLPPLFAPAHRS